MFSVLFLLTLVSFSEASNLPDDQKDQKRNWSVGLSHSLSFGAYYEARAKNSNGLSFSYNYKDFKFSAKGSYVFDPFGFVSDPSYLGLTDISLGASKPLKSMENFLGFKWNASAGLVLPTAKKSLKKGKYFALFGRLSHYHKFKDKFSFGFNHVLYSDSYKYRTDVSGNSNRLAASSHEVQLTGTFNKLTLSGTGTFYIYTYFADLDPDPNVSDTKLKFKGYQGANFNLSYMVWAKHHLRGFMGWSINVPIISPILTGFPIFKKRYWVYNLGLSWAI